MREARLKTIHWSLFTLVGAYIGTTGLGAALFTTPFGQRHLAEFLHPEAVPFDWLATLGSTTYWAILLSLLVVVPVAAIATNAALGRIFQSSPRIEIPTWIPLLLVAAFSSFCIYKLAEAGALSAQEFWDRSVCFEDKMRRRTELFTLLGNRYYAFCYSSLPILSSYLLSRLILHKDGLAGLGFVITSGIIAWLSIATIMKAPILIYIGVIALTLIFCGVGFFRSLLFTVPVAIVIYLTLSQLQFCVQQGTSWDKKTTEEQAPALAQPQETSLAYRAMYMTRAALFRMAASYPYYLQEFSEPEKRCGIQMPPPFPRQRCFPSTKIFSLMYPNVKYVQGFAPAAVNVSAYAESGPLYAIFAMVLCGGIIGLLAFLTKAGGALSISLAVAACIFSYYVTQVPFTGLLVDSYGLLWLVLPLVCMILIASLPIYRRRRQVMG